jgi:hypothetical protein
LDDKDFSTNETDIVASTESINAIRAVYGNRYRLHTLLEGGRHVLLVTDDIDKENPQIFSESYVIANLINKPQ